MSRDRSRNNHIYYVTSFRCDGGGVDDRRRHDDHTVYPQHVLRFNCMIHSHTRDYGLFASLLGASERTLHHDTVFRHDAHPADRLQASSRSACAPERGSRRRPATLLPYPVGGCARACARAAATAVRAHTPSLLGCELHRSWVREVDACWGPGVPDADARMTSRCLQNAEVRK